MWLYDYNIKKSTLLTSLQSLLYSKKNFFENVDSQQTAFLTKKSAFLPESAIFWDFRPAAVQRRPSQTRTPKGVTKSCSTLF